MDAKAEITLLKNKGETYTLSIGKRHFTFKALEKRQVPVAVALIAQRKIDSKGNKLFEVDIHTPIFESKSIEKDAIDCKDTKQNVTANTPQKRFEQWP